MKGRVVDGKGWKGKGRVGKGYAMLFVQKLVTILFVTLCQHSLSLVEFSSMYYNDFMLALLSVSGE